MGKVGRWKSGLGRQLDENPGLDFRVPGPAASPGQSDLLPLGLSKRARLIPPWRQQL